MIEHVGNCHGEWNVILSVLAGLPVVGILTFKAKALWRKITGKQCAHTCDEH
jgi:hypothetical protein